MNSLSFSAAKTNLGNIFIAGPQAKAAKKPRTSPCKNLPKGQKCLARERPDRDGRDE